MYRIEHTKLRNIVENIQICFDPDDLTTLISEDASTIDQYREFEAMVDDCNGGGGGGGALEIEGAAAAAGKSKWVIRIKMNAEEMLDWNLSMDDVHFAIKNSYQDQVACIYSDYNADKLIFRLRMNSMMNKKKTGQSSLDQSDKIY